MEERPIEGVGTAVAAFVGLAPEGPIDDPVGIDVDGWGTDEDAIWGAIQAGSLRPALRSFFENGGRSAIGIRVEDAGLEGVTAGLEALDRVDLVNLLVLPAESAEQDDARTIVAEAAIGTAGPNAALYLPRLRRSDPMQGAPEAFSPAAAVAGVMARTDFEQGVWSAPAGTDADLRGADGLEFDLGTREAEALNELGISTLRRFPGRGPVVWGARTLAGADAAASEWKYVPVRRTALFLEESIERGLRWTQFEPNGEELWAAVRKSVGVFLHDLFRSGAFHGDTPSRAYFVRCDRDTVTQGDLDAGGFTVHVGFAPIKPAEFIVLRIRARALPPND